ncbi:pyridoxal phosphate-dependent aminotransferase [Photobacterium arenosum]|uniref:pyridoxal phosphate-dependent aminotransferase n=1 Tax=Photobacterium arenosum TaxID=2774143 RepID=UPI00288AD0F2|nr:histidinol-phosphate transaminase [Photobacterium arenosum]
MTIIRNYNENSDDVLHRLHMSEVGSYPTKDIENTLLNAIEKTGLYPDPTSRELVEVIANYHGLQSDNIFVGNGLDEVIFLLCCAYLKHGKKAMFSDATYPGYAMSTNIHGGVGISVPLRDFHICVTEYRSTLQLNPDVTLAFICNPHNPCGTVLDRSAILELVRYFNKFGVIVVVDEAYIDFIGSEIYSVINDINEHPNLIVLRSLSKTHALSGLRLGYAVSKKENLSVIFNVAKALPFRVNAIAQKVGVIALKDKVRHQTIIDNSKGYTSEVMSVFRSLDIDFIPSETNFVLFNHRSVCDEFIDKLQAMGVHVRDCDLFGLPGWARVSFISQSDVDVFCQALRKYHGH